MPMGKRIPQTVTWRNMCIQRMESMGAFASSSEISSWWVWARTTLRDARSTTAVLRKRCAIGREKCGVVSVGQRMTPKQKCQIWNVRVDAHPVAASVFSPVRPPAHVHPPSRNELVSLRLDVHLIRHRSHHHPQLRYRQVYFQCRRKHQQGFSPEQV